MTADDHFLVVVYDISNDRRRTKLHERLNEFGTPVQYSVFECLLSSARVVELKKAVRKIIRPRLDHVRYYMMCASCRAKTEVVGGKEMVQHVPVMVV